jgi:hypothetical protein
MEIGPQKSQLKTAKNHELSSQKKGENESTS